MGGVPFFGPDLSMHFFPVLGIEISVFHNQSAAWSPVGRVPFSVPDFSMHFFPFWALRFQRLTAKVSQELCERGAVLWTGLFDALFTCFVH